MKRIDLTRGQHTIVDDEDFEWLSQQCWQATLAQQCCTKGLMYSATSSGFAMHRQILGLEVGDKRKVKHTNGDNLDNRRSNLEIVCTKKKKIVSTRRSRWKELVYNSVK